MRFPTSSVAVLMLVALAGCKVIVLGDSNSCIRVGDACTPELWPGVLQGFLDDARSLWFVENRAMPGMSAGIKRDEHGDERQHSVLALPLGAPFHLERLLREDHLIGICRIVPFEALAPRLVIALGTNDMDAPAGVIADRIMALERRVREAAPCVRVYVATIPPRFDSDFAAANVQRMVANALLRARVPPDRLIEFDTGFVRADFHADGIHVTRPGHLKRAQAAMRVLLPELAVPQPAPTP